MKKLFILSVVSFLPLAQFAWASEEPGLTQPQKGRVAALAEMEAQNKLSGIPLEVPIEPVLPEKKFFKFGTSSSNSVTPSTLSLLNRKAFEETGADSVENRDARNTGIILLILMVREVQYDTPNAQKILTTPDKDKVELAKKILLQYLDDNKGIFKGYKEYYEKNGSLNIDQVTKLNERITADILQGPEAQVKVFEKPEILDEEYTQKQGERVVIPLKERQPPPEESAWWTKWIGLGK